MRDLGEHRLKDLAGRCGSFSSATDDFRRLDQSEPDEPSGPPRIRSSVGNVELAELQSTPHDPPARDPDRSRRLGQDSLGLQTAAELVEGVSRRRLLRAACRRRHPDLVQPTIAATIGVHDTTELRDRKALLVVDNFEHLLDAAPTVSALLAVAQNVRVLVTSRAPLRVDGEHEFPIEPLPEVDAVDLLTQRARAVRPDFKPDETALEICRRLDGLPLALELAASRLRSLGSRALLDRLEHRMSLLTGGRRDAPERHRTLRATIEWSYDLLNPVQQRLFSRLAVFATFSAAAAAAVADATVDDLDELVEASLLKPMHEDRFLMLETIREFAAERLRPQEGSESRRRHADRVLRIPSCNARPSALHGSALAQAQIFEAEEDNLRAALGHSLESGPNEVALDLVDALWLHWMSRGQLEEGQQWTERALEKGLARAHAGAG